MEQLATAPQPANDIIKDTNTASFMKDVIETSQEVPVIVDFWAPWCGPCKQLGPVLEKAVTAKKGKVRMVKVNVDENQQLAANMQIQSIPAVFIFYGGRPVDGFMGAVPESQIKTLVDKLAAIADSGEAADIKAILDQANTLMAEGNIDHAAALFMEVLKLEPENPTAYIGLIRITMADGGDVGPLIEHAPQAVKESKEWPAVETMLALAQKAAEAGPLDELKAKIDADPKDCQARYDYAMALYAGGKKEEGVDQLLEIVRTNRKWNDDQARKELLTIFEALGHADPLTVSARKHLSTLLFS